MFSHTQTSEGLLSIAVLRGGFFSSERLTATSINPTSVVFTRSTRELLIERTRGSLSRIRSDKTAISHQLTEEATFGELVAQWRKERGVTSSITKMAMTPAYQRIIAMGARAVPLILKRLEAEGDEPDMWFWALQAITGADPVDPDERGDMSAMAKRWLHWARANGYGW